MNDNVPVRGDFPSNTRKTKPAVERVVKTPARIDKGSLGKQALQAFFAEDIKEVAKLPSLGYCPAERQERRERYLHIRDRPAALRRRRRSSAVSQQQDLHLIFQSDVRTS